jgi:nitronate monooxygenase
MNAMSAAGRALLDRLRLPVCVAPMFLVTGPALVVAARRAGIMAAIPTQNARTLKQLDGWLREIAVADAPGHWAANLITHSTNTRLRDDLAIVARYRPPVVITALGSPRPAIELVHSYGGIVIGDVVNLALAKKSVEAGADGLACICAGAGGHTGYLSPFAFLSAVRSFFDGMVIVGGGIGDGAGVAGAVAAGADLVYMGTRFIPTDESLAEPAFKTMVAEGGIDDVVVSAEVTGTPASWLKASLRPLGWDPDRLPDDPEKLYDFAGDIPRRWKEIWSAGQSLVGANSVEPVAAVVDTLEREYRAALRRMDGMRATLY